MNVCENVGNIKVKDYLKCSPYEVWLTFVKGNCIIVMEIATFMSYVINYMWCYTTDTTHAVSVSP